MGVSGIPEALCQSSTMSTAPHSRERFDEFIETLRRTAEATPEIVGFVGLGSTAARHRADEWSDHDFALVTLDGTEDSFRQDLGWLPWAHSVALSVIEDHGGMKVIYDDGHVLEYGITSLAHLAQWKANSWEVFYDGGGVTATMQAIDAETREIDANDGRDIRLVLTQLLIGVGRARRGETLSAGQSIRAEATSYLLAVLGRRLPGAYLTLDSLDPRRRFDTVHPALAAEIASALRLAPEPAARALLDIAERELAPGWHEFPMAGADAVRRRLGWDRP